MLLSIRRAVLFIAAMIAFLPGCAPKAPETLTVSGTVNFEGVPVEYGRISFFPLDPSFGPQSGDIKNGTFEFQARPGTMRVEIRASKPLKGSIARDGYIPARYNTESRMIEEVSETNKHFEFNLTEK